MQEHNENVGRRSGIDRRTLTKGAAWSVPVIAAAVSAPAAAASTVAGQLVVTADCGDLVLGDNPSFTLTATGGATAAQTFFIQSGEAVNASLQDAWTTGGGVTLTVLSGNQWQFQIPALADGESVTFTSNAALVDLLTTYTGSTADSTDSFRTYLGAAGLVTLCTT